MQLVSVLLLSCATVARAAPLAPTVTIAPGVQMPVVALGTGEYQGAAAAAAVESAIRLGYRAIDTAHEYGNQQAVGQGIRAALANSSAGLRRRDIFVITKVEGGLSAAATTARLQLDLQQLGLGASLDLVLLHYPKAAPLMTLSATIQEQWRAIAAFAEGGGARAAGVSQFCSGAFAALDAAGAALRPALNQVGWHVGMGPDPCGVASMCATRKDLTAMAYSPLDEASSELLGSGVAVEIAAQHSVTPAQVALRWLAQRGVPYAVAASNPVYQAQNLDVFRFELNVTELAMLDADKKPAGCPFWPGSACWSLTACGGSCGGGGSRGGPFAG